MSDAQLWFLIGSLGFGGLFAFLAYWTGVDHAQQRYRRQVADLEAALDATEEIVGTQARLIDALRGHPVTGPILRVVK